MAGAAFFNADKTRRFLLTRTWSEDARRRPLLWVMLNPSIAGAQDDDPTIRRCVGFTRRDEESFGGLEVVNLFSLIATDPSHLVHHPDPVGENRAHIDHAMMRARYAVLAWGATVERVRRAQDEIDYVFDRARAHDVTLMHLGQTKAGHPKHPLYLAGDTPWGWV